MRHITIEVDMLRTLLATTALVGALATSAYGVTIDGKVEGFVEGYSLGFAVNFDIENGPSGVPAGTRVRDIDCLRPDHAGDDQRQYLSRE